MRWYGLMYVVAFVVAYYLYRRQIRERRFPMSEDDLWAFFFWGILALMLGARIFSTLVYDPSDRYWRQPWLVFWPFENGQFTGLQGMSYHGGVIGGILGFTVYAVVKKYDVREIADMFGASIPLGYTFGRLGNFINGELWGRVTTSPLGMIFPTAPRFSATLDWARETAEATGVPVPGPEAMLNLPRHPSQLYEALFEGVVLWLIIWLLRNRKPFKGFLAGLYIGGYGLIRFFLEYFREPDAHLGYRIQLGQVVGLRDIAHLHPALSFSTGQILCLGMVVLALVWCVVVARLPGCKPVRRYPGPGELDPGASAARLVEKDAARKQRRRLRQKLR
jgi:phosphatidylglycerol:prolipoprotein diacylglycerol transferase